MSDEENEKDEKVARLTMQWPADLKEAVRARVGPRGLTDFTIEAVRAKLGTHDEHKADSKELSECRDLAQRLVDAIALGGDYEDRAETLRMMDLPASISTAGWPAHLVDIVKPEDSTPEVVEPVAPPAVGDPGTIRSAQPPARSALAERVRAKAMEKGVDLSGVDLRPASDIEQPEPEPEDLGTGAVHEQPKLDPNACPNCGAVLVAGECWECG